MAFFGLNFLFAGQYSQNYGLYIKSINNNGVIKSDAGANVDIFGDSVYRKPRKYLYGTSMNEVLSFDIEFLSETPIYGHNRTKMEKWLFGQQEYQKLQIIQQDLQNIYFNCFLIDAKTIYVGNLCYGFTCSVECDAPFAWQLEKTYVYQNNTNSLLYNIDHYNDSDINSYTLPYLEIHMNNIGGTVYINNDSDGGRETSFEELAPNEVISIDNDLHIISSDMFEYRSDKFNKKFFRLLYGLNHLRIRGNVSKIVLRYKNVRKVGG